MLTKTALAASSLFLATQAHLFLQSPTPMQGNAVKDPLEASGSNFPCHGVSIPSSGGQQMAAGSSQLLEFDAGNGENGAVHGGGSCQISITYETDAAKVKDPSNWHVIYSIEGGCPSTTTGNLASGTVKQCASDNDVDCLHQFHFTIPKGIKSGHGTLAWTWFNTIGNREMYMNCVSADFTGGDGSEMSSFPNMFVANLASLGTCATKEQTYVGFPDPGKYVTTVLPAGAPSSDIYPISTPTNAACGTAGGSPSGTGAAITTASSQAPSSYNGGAPSSGNNGMSTQSGGAAPSANTDVPSGTATGPASSVATSNTNAPVTLTTMMTVTGSRNGGETSAPTTVASSNVSTGAVGQSSAPAGNTGAAAPSAPPAAGAGAGNTSTGKTAGTSSGTCANGAVACSSPGSTICIGSTQFGICDTNNCAIPQTLASGTSCSGGVIGATVGKRGEPCHSSAPRNGTLSMRR